MQAIRALQVITKILRDIPAITKNLREIQAVTKNLREILSHLDSSFEYLQSVIRLR